MVLIIDNYDSFTYNLYQYFCQLGVKVKVIRNDQVTISQIKHLNPSHLVISPGPGTPNDAGISLSAVRYFSGKLAILGVCLGHQTIGQVIGGKIIRASRIMHGKTCKIYHKNIGIFTHLKNPLTVMRYHSLVIDPKTIPPSLEITAWCYHKKTLEIMGIRHRSSIIEGIQFHPESILTEQGYQLLENFLNQ